MKKVNEEIKKDFLTLIKEGEYYPEKTMKRFSNIINYYLKRNIIPEIGDLFSIPDGNNYYHITVENVESTYLDNNNGDSVDEHLEITARLEKV